MPEPYVTVPRERVWWDADAAVALSREVSLRAARRPFVLISGSLHRPGGAGRPLVDALGVDPAAVFDGISQHTPLARVLAAAARARAVDADLVVAIGGGSVIDGAKALKAALGDGLDTAESFAARAMGAASGRAPSGHGPPIVAVPTTLSAAEFSCRAGYTSPLTGLKEGVRALGLAPSTVVLDPRLARATPAALWYASGIRAVDHAVEAIFAEAAWPGLRAQAAAGLALLAPALRDAFASPEDIAPRARAQQAVWLISEVLEQVPMGASHGLGYLLGAVAGVPHGLTSCVLLPSVVALNTPARPEAAALVAHALGGTVAADALRALVGALDLPTQLHQLEPAPDGAALDRIAQLAVSHPTVRANPVRLDDPHQVRALLDRAW